MKTKRIRINSDIYFYYIWFIFIFLKQFEARHVPWFAGGYHGTFWIFGLKPSRLFPIWCYLRPGVSHGLRAATMEQRSEFLAWNLPGCFPFGVVWGQARPMVCGWLPWNVLDLCFLGKHWTTFLTQNAFFLDRFFNIGMGLSCNSSSVGMNFLHSFMSGLPQPAC